MTEAHIKSLHEIVIEELTSSAVALIVLGASAYMWMNQIAMYEGQTTIIGAVVTHYIVQHSA